MSGLSEKAKGKRRAIEQDQDGEAPPPVPQGRTLTIRFSEGLPDLHLLVGPNDNVREIQRKVRRSPSFLFLFIQKNASRSGMNVLALRADAFA